MYLPNEPEVLAARLAFPDAQAALAGGGEDRLPFQAALGWYGTEFDEERGAFAIIASDGPLAAYVGDRLLLRGARGRSLFVYAFGSSDLPEDWDLAVPRRAYFALSRPTIDPIRVTVEVVAG